MLIISIILLFSYENILSISFIISNLSDWIV